MCANDEVFDYVKLCSVSHCVKMTNIYPEQNCIYLFFSILQITKICYYILFILGLRFCLGLWSQSQNLKLTTAIFIERTSMETWILCFINYYLTQQVKIESRTTSDLLVTLAISKPMYRMVCSGGRNWLRYWSAFIICSLTIRSLCFFSFVCTTNNQSNASIHVTWPRPYCFIQIFTKWHASNMICKVLNFASVFGNVPITTLVVIHRGDIAGKYFQMSGW